MINYYVSIRYTIHFIGCHPVSPHEEKREAEKREVKGKSMAKALYPIGGREWDHTKGKPQTRKKQTGKRER